MIWNLKHGVIRSINLTKQPGNKVITKNERLSKVLERHPFLKQQLTHRFGAYGNGNNRSILDMIGKKSRVYEVARLVGVNSEMFLEFLNTAIGLKEEYLKQKLQQSLDKCQKPDDEDPPEWLDKMEFEVIDVREGPNTYIAEISIKAKSLPANKGLKIIHSLDPMPLIYVMAGMGWTHFCKIVGIEEYHIYFTQDERVLKR
jgi:hypothetical protein